MPVWYKKKLFIPILVFLISISIVLASDWTYSAGNINIYMFENNSIWNRSGANNLLPFIATDGLRIPALPNCDTIDTDVDGIMSCGSDATGDNPKAWKLDNFTVAYEDEIPTCAGGEYTTGDGSDLSCSTPTDTHINTDTMDIVNVSMLDNKTIIRLGNTSWAIKVVNDSISSYYNHSIDLSNRFLQSEIFTHIGNNITSNNASLNAYGWVRNNTDVYFSNVGIGIANPAHKLHVIGNINITGSFNATRIEANEILVGGAVVNRSIDLTPYAPLDSPTFTTAFTATGLVSEADLDLSDITLADFTNDVNFLVNDTSGDTNMSIGNFSITQYNSSCVGFKFSTGGGIFSCT